MAEQRGWAEKQRGAEKLVFPSGPSHRMGWGFQRGIHSVPVPLNPLWLGGIGAPGDAWGGGELCLCLWGQEVRGQERFQGCLQPLGAGQQHLKPNELSPHSAAAFQAVPWVWMPN